MWDKNPTLFREVLCARHGTTLPHDGDAITREGGACEGAHKAEWGCGWEGAEKGASCLGGSVLVILGGVGEDLHLGRGGPSQATVCIVTSMGTLDASHAHTHTHTHTYTSPQIIHPYIICCAERWPTILCFTLSHMVMTSTDSHDAR